MRARNTQTQTQTYQPPLTRSSIPRSASAQYTLQSSRMPSSSPSRLPTPARWCPCCFGWCARSSRAVHCASACSAIHTCFRANARSGALAGFCAGQSSGWIFSERWRHRRLQKRAAHAAALDVEVVLDFVGQCRMSDGRWWFVSGVVQCAHARDASCKS
jgi:hypothetical protein